jgi:exodeoxyribonuclease III
MYSFLSWNVNLYNDKTHEELKQYIDKYDVIFLSETKSKDLSHYFNQFINYNYIQNPNDPARYHGVCMLIKKTINYSILDINLGIESRNDTKTGNPVTGHIIGVNLNDEMFVIGTYVPNSGVKGIGPNYYYRVDKWDIALYNYLNYVKQFKFTLWMGDINVAFNDIDVSNPSIMKDWAGFREEERNNLNRYFESGWIDLWRLQNPNVVVYSWLGKNTGLRLDNMIVSRMPQTFDTLISTNPSSSDHVPIMCLIQP